jgi:hypothetical protein
MVNTTVMNGGSQLAGRWTGAEDDAVVEEAGTLSDIDLYEDDAPPPDRWPVVAGVLAILTGAAWLALIVVSKADLFSRAITPATIAEIVTIASPPLVLIGLLYLIAIRHSRSEAARLARVSGNLRAEQVRLESTLTSIAQRLDTERAEIEAHTDRLMTVGEEATTRLRAVADRLKADLEAAAREAEVLRDAAHAARGDMNVLLTDLPRAHAQTVEMSGALEAAGLAAHEQAGALDSQISALVARGREADEIAGGAAQKLAAHLARVEGVSENAGAQLTAAAETMTAAVDSALSRAAEAGDAARQGMEAQGAAMRALVEQSEAALARTGADAADALARRIDDVTERLEALGAMLASHETTGSRMVDGLGEGIDRIDSRFAAIDTEADARHARLSAAIEALTNHAETLKTALDAGSGTTETLIGRAEALMTALYAASREIDETLPQSLARLDTHAGATRAKIDEIAPEVTRMEQEASRTLDRLLEAEAALVKQREALDALGDALDTRLARGVTAAGDMVTAVEGADARAREIADGSATALVDAMVRVRETAQAAAERAREALAAVVPDSAERLSTAVKQALQGAVSGQVEAQIGELAATAERAVASANTASDRLMRQMLTIAETSAQVEARINEAHAEIEEADRDNFTRRVALLIESLNSTAIDVTKILSNDVTDSAWGAYLKGDRGVFTRRAVRLLDAGEVREIANHYNDDAEFRDQVNRYIRDFEAMLRNVLATRAGSPLGVTLLSSDMGKLYVALAQAIERLRS